jgi:hypothetical protein
MFSASNYTSTNNRIIDRRDNIVLVDFEREPDPPAPRFPGASGVRPVAAAPVRASAGAPLR